MKLGNSHWKSTPDSRRDPRAVEVYRTLTNPAPPDLRSRRRAPRANDEVQIGSDWAIQLPAAAPTMVAIAAGDLARFLRQALGVKLATPGAGRKLVRVSIDPDHRRLRGCSKRQHVIDVREDGIAIVGASEWGAACGLYHLQRLLKLRRAPCLKLARIVATPALDPSLTALAFQPEQLELQDPLPFHGEYLKRIARAGYTGFHLYLHGNLFYRSQVLRELNHPDAAANLAALRRIVAYCRDHALDVFLSYYTLALPHDHLVFRRHPTLRGSTMWHSAQERILCTSQPLTRAFHEEQLARLFRGAPGLAGVFMITGCEGFLHCYTAPGPRIQNQTDCPHCRHRNPEATVSSLMNTLARTVKRVSPSARFVVWTYGAFTWTRPPEAGDQIARLSKDCTLMSNFDTGDHGVREGVRFMHPDYNLTCVGPSSVFRSQIRGARRRGLAVMAKVESGSGLEMYTVPSIPALTRWARKYERILQSGAVGALFSWQFVGYTESLSAELAAWMSWRPCPPATELLRRLAARDFGRQHATTMIAAWRLFDRALEHFPFSLTAGYFRGPWYCGFTHPLVLDALRPGQLSPQFWKRGDYPTPLFFADLRWCQPFGVEAFLATTRKMERLWRAGCQVLARTQDPQRADPHVSGKLREQRALAEGILCMIRTAIHLVEFYDVRDRYFRESSDLRRTRAALTRLREIAKRELANSVHGLRCLRANPLLGFSYIYGHGFTEEMARSKIEHTRRLIEFELPATMFQYSFMMHARDEWIDDDKRKYR